jgi:hypothetical protein
VDLQAANSALRVTGTPARHGPADGDRGPVIGFVLALVDRPDRGVYISGDTVLLEELCSYRDFMCTTAATKARTPVDRQ